MVVLTRAARVVTGTFTGPARASAGSNGHKALG
jgi:hypothetical protein